MSENIDNVNISIVDVVGKIEDGVGLVLNLTLQDLSYDIGYWFNKDGYVRIVPDDNFLDLLNVNSIYEYERYDDLIYIIHSKIPNMNKIIEEYLN